MSLENREKQFWNGITNLNMFLSIMIVIYHTNGYYFYQANGGVSDLTIEIIEFVWHGLFATIPVPLFIFLSAFLLYRNISKNTMVQKMKKRVRSLVIPYMLWNGIAALFLWILQTIPFIARHMEVREKESFDILSLLRGITIEPYDGVLWTVLQLIIFLIMLPVIYMLVYNKYIGLLIVILSYFVAVGTWDIFFLIHGNSNLFYYCTGTYIGLHGYKYLAKVKNRYYLVGATLILLVILTLYHMDIRNILFNMVAILCIYTIFIYTGKYTQNSSQICYGLSFWIYVIHNLLQPCIMKMIQMFGPSGNIGAWMNFVLSPVITILICIVVAKICKKITPRCYSVLSGGRG